MSNPDKIRSYIIERLTLNNIGDLEQLHSIVYNRKQQPDYFIKKYDTAYTGVSYIGFIAYNKARVPMAYYGVIPTLLWYNDKVILGAQSADTMTNPQYRNTGLFTELAELTFKLCANEGIRIIFGFPNQNSYPGLIKLKWRMTESMERFDIPVKGALPLEKIANKYPILKSLYINYQNIILKNYSKPQKGLENSVLADGYNGVFRDNNYLQYKTFSATRVIEIDGTLVWIKMRNGLQVGDIAHIHDFSVFIKKLQGLARKLGLQQIQFHTSHGTRLHSFLIKQYQPGPSFAVLFKDLGYDIATDRIKFTFADIDIF